MKKASPVIVAIYLYVIKWNNDVKFAKHIYDYNIKIFSLREKFSCKIIDRDVFKSLSSIYDRKQFSVFLLLSQS